MQICSLKKCKKLLLLFLISFNFTEAQSFSLDDAVKIALSNIAADSDDDVVDVMAGFCSLIHSSNDIIGEELLLLLL